jgi:hypothetical protein
VWLHFRRRFELAVDFTIKRCSLIDSTFSSTGDMSVEYVEKHSEGLSTMHPYEMPQSNNGLC